MGVARNHRYAVVGLNNVQCQRCQRILKSDEVMIQPGEGETKLIVCALCVDEPHPQRYAPRLPEKEEEAAVVTQVEPPDHFNGTAVDGQSIGPDTSAYNGTVATGTNETNNTTL